MELRKQTFVRGICSFCLSLIFLGWGGAVQAGQLSDRLARFPHWDSKPPVASAEGDLFYPDWMKGTWTVTSTLVDLVAPLAPDVVSPGFESNRRYLHQPVSFQVRFQSVAPNTFSLSIWNSKSKVQLNSQAPQRVVADRTFNGLNIAKVYLGEQMIQSVKVDPDSPNRQVTLLRGGYQLVSIVTSRGTETPSPDRFIATEVSQQIFRGSPQLYFNGVETTTAYHQLTPTSTIEADQVTAVYLSPQDPDYFKALDRPIALYRYRLELVPIENKDKGAQEKLVSASG